MNATQIKEACKTYNAEYPECFSEIDAGTPVVIATYGSKQGSRWTRFTAFVGVRCGDKMIGAGVPAVKEITGRVARGTYGDIAAKFASQFVSSDVAIEVVSHGV
jgi:hypothetical protein